MIVFRFHDGDSEMTVTMHEGCISIRRPNKGMTPKLQKIADRFVDENMLGKNAEKVKTFIQQSDSISVLVGEERCG